LEQQYLNYYWTYRSISFKNGFTSQNGLSDENKVELFELLTTIRKKNPKASIKTYATAIFRKIELSARKKLLDECFDKTGVYLNIIDHNLENFYLEKALTGKSKMAEPVLLINIGGGSTELVVMYGDEAIERKNIGVGVGTVLQKFKTINKDSSEVGLNKVIDFVNEQLPTLENKVKTGFYTGGELNYMQLTGYKLEANTLFKDSNHPSIISTKNFAKRNSAIYTQVTIKELEQLMPKSPAWMHGARACSALAQAICEKYGIEFLIPSNANLIDGVVQQEFKYVTLSGSFRKHLDYILKIKKKLEKTGAQILSPRFTKPKNPGEEFVVFAGEEGLSPLQLERHHLDSIDKSDALIVCDKDGYVGASALIEIGCANALGKRIIFVETPKEFKLNTLPAEIGLLCLG